MSKRISPRLSAIVNALSLWPGIRVLEIGCGSGVAVRAVVNRIGTGYVLGIDRSAKAIEKANSQSKIETSSRLLRFRQIAIEEFELQKGEKP